VSLGRLGAELLVKLGLVVVDDYLDLAESDRSRARTRSIEGLVDSTSAGLRDVVRGLVEAYLDAIERLQSLGQEEDE